MEKKRGLRSSNEIAVEVAEEVNRILEALDPRNENQQSTPKKSMNRPLFTLSQDQSSESCTELGENGPPPPPLSRAPGLSHIGTMTTTMAGGDCCSPLCGGGAGCEDQGPSRRRPCHRVEFDDVVKRIRNMERAAPPRIIIPIPRYPSKGFESIQQFKTAFLAACEANGIEEEEQQKKILRSQLQGYALESLLQMQEKLEDCTVTPEELLDELSRVVDFLPNDRYVQTEFRSCLRRKDEKFEDFAKRVRTLGMRAFKALNKRELETFLVDRFIEGLESPDVQFELRKNAFDSLPEAVSQAHVLRSALDQYSHGRGRQYRSAINYVQQQYEDSDGEDEFVTRSVQAAQKPPDRGPRPKEQVKPSGFDELKNMVSKVIDGMDSMRQNVDRVEKKVGMLVDRVNEHSEAIVTLRKGHEELQNKVGKLEASSSDGGGRMPRGTLWVPPEQRRSERGSGGGGHGGPPGCYNCGSPEHFARACPRPRVNHVQAEFPKNEERPWAGNQ